MADQSPTTTTVPPSTSDTGMASLSRFEIGDRVLCLAAPGAGQLEAGRVYFVQELIGCSESFQLLGLNVWPGQMWGSWRFSKVNG